MARDESLKIYTPTEIQDTPFPQEGEAFFGSSQSSTGGNYSPETIQDNNFPDPRVAFELIGSALNTRSKKILAEFEFTPSGALQIGQYQSGVSGDIRISPNGIVARNDLGETTFSLDGTTGDAVFAGTIQTGTIISGLVIVGNNSIVIDGRNPSAPRFLLYNNGIPQILIGKRA